jgi:hypothetical protein
MRAVFQNNLKHRPFGGPVQWLLDTGARLRTRDLDAREDEFIGPLPAEPIRFPPSWRGCEDVPADLAVERVSEWLFGSRHGGQQSNVDSLARRAETPARRGLPQLVRCTCSSARARNHPIERSDNVFVRIGTINATFAGAAGAAGVRPSPASPANPAAGPMRGARRSE